LTRERLNEHFELRKKLKEDKESLKALRDRAYPGAQVITGMPHGSDVYDKVGELVGSIVYLEEKIAQLEETVRASEVEILQFIDSLSDHQAAVAFRLRYIGGMYWKEVAGILGGRYTEKSIQTKCNSYLER